ncbi:MAG: bifunctional 4-hydroxy-2-oxoglutarate aldolase/2-dehydro-3-deoxy-phosphogluconate aldolase [Clostridiales Family XIII bacterium]|jgi:2-dehydro-3-deoxyphosphogluconate aldolase/(4S)-4-hydroxy-2-oxoglutarate aldolase|nr:bifunctional 4-hydroxy-2-oxoglutarate aldolase/2-dehydro-3-deoxy-phosphogluconate aldolase [Clostridiales Family XIII bacterium]
MVQLSVEEKVKRYGLVPVVSFQDAGQAVPAAAALEDAYLGIMEITLRTDAGLESIRRVKALRPSVLVGAGTVLSAENAKAAVDAGAEFIVSPGYQDDIVDWCAQNAVPVFPGCVTPTEIQCALRKGLRTLKFFPANIYGGLKAMKALNGPFASAGLSFVPTGGVDNSNLSEYARSPFIAAIGGSWICTGKDLEAGDFQHITATARAAIDILLGFGYSGMGDAGQVGGVAGQTGGTARPVGGAVGQAGGAVELAEGAAGQVGGAVGQAGGAARPAGDAAGGHAAVAEAAGRNVIMANSIPRTVFYLEKKGFRLLEGGGAAGPSAGIGSGAGIGAAGIDPASGPVPGGTVCAGPFGDVYSIMLSGN